MFFKRTLAPSPSSFSGFVHVEKEGREKNYSIAEFEDLFKIRFIPQLDFSYLSLLNTITKKIAKLHKKDQLSLQQLWFGNYFKKEILTPTLPSVSLRWINFQVGWGVFAKDPIKKMEFIGEYGGKVRKRRGVDTKNAYCFEYTLAEGKDSPYIVDAREQGGIVRYINHSNTPNLTSALATFDNISHIILLAKEPIPKGSQLFYDYGANYWAHRAHPEQLK